MTKNYTKGHTTKAWPKLALLGLLGLATGAAHAQKLDYSLAGASNVSGVYTDLGATATTIATPNTDDANSEALPIGFDFSFNGQKFSKFVLNTNGYLALGEKAPAAPYFPTTTTSTTSGPLNDPAQTNLILPFNIDLEDATIGAAGYSYTVSGSPGERVCTIQWKRVSDKSGATGPAKQYNSLDFQVKLYETSNRIEFVYNTAIPSTNAEAFKSAVVGVKGSGTTQNQLVLASKGSVALWSTATFISTTYLAGGGTTGVNAHNFRRSVGPDAGRTYRFEATKANDVAVGPIYSLGKLPVPYATPHVVKVRVNNVGKAAQANVKFTLNVTGANTFTSTVTVPALAIDANGILSFPAFTPTNQGTNTITVKADDDENNANNSTTFTQLVNSNTFAYAQPGLATAANGSIGFDTGDGILGVKYTTNEARTVTGVTVHISNNAASVDNKVYGVVLDGNGAIIARSPDYTLLASDLDKDKTFSLSAAIPAGTFVVGLAQTANATTGYFPVSAQAYEIPTRTDTYFSIPLAGGDLSDAAAANLGALMIEAITDAAATCPPPSGVTVAGLTSNSAIVSFTGPANGTAYSVIYGPKGFDPASAGTTVPATTSPVTLTGLMPLTNYDVYVRAICTAPDESTLAGPVTFITTCVPPIVATFPYMENFDGVTAGALPCGVAVADINADGKTWSNVATGTPASPKNHMRYTYSEANAADDWFFTPALFLKEGYSYQLTFKYKAALASFPEGLEVKYGNATTPAAQSNLLWRNVNIDNVAYATTMGGDGDGQVRTIKPTATGNYYIGFHAISAKNNFYLYVDDVMVTATVSGTSSALQRAITLYPNPTAGNLKVDVRGANAKNGLQVEVSNMLGQRVHTSSVRDNAVKTIDLSNLANGMYTVKVLNGDEFMVRTISVQK